LGIGKPGAANFKDQNPELQTQKKSNIPNPKPPVADPLALTADSRLQTANRSRYCSFPPAGKVVDIEW